MSTAVIEAPIDTTSKKRILLYGSCVSRDPLDGLLKSGSGLEIAAYIARTSVVSQFSQPGPAGLEPPAGTNFAARMIQHDLRKDVGDRILRMDFDYLLLDLIDERLPLLNVQGSIVTGSRFLYDAFPELMNLKRAVDIHSESGRQVFATSLRQMLSTLKDSGFPQERVILHRAWWARHVLTAGTARLMGTGDLEKAHRNNVFLAEAYRIIKAELPHCLRIEIDKTKLVADPDHKWGLAPFHYVEAYYEEFQSKLTRLLWTPQAEKPPATTPRVAAPPRVPTAHAQPATKLAYDAPRLAKNVQLVPGLGLYSGWGNQPLPLVTSYGLDEPYPSHHKASVAEFGDGCIEFDRQDVPLNRHRCAGLCRYSVTIGQHGLSCLARHLDQGDSAQLQTAVNTARWLIDNQGADGAWPSGFDHNGFTPRCAAIKAPWPSAMGQGLCISLLARLHRLYDTAKPAAQPALQELDRPALRRAALRATVPFQTDSAQGGVRTLLNGRHVFYEAYPTSPSSLALDGFMCAIVGLHDLWQLTDDDGAKRLYQDGLQTLRECVHLFDLGRATASDLTHLTCRDHPPNIASRNDHRSHVQLLSALNLIAGGFEPELERWCFYLKGWGMRNQAGMSGV